MISPDLEKWLEDRPNMEKDNPSGLSRRATRPSLDRITLLCQYLGDPQLDIDAVHITGTNGKTSTSRIIDSLFTTRGMSTGRITSPHLSVLNERINLNNEAISDSELQDVLTTIKNVEESVEQVRADAPSYFEIMVAAGFYAMNSSGIQAGIIEVGMGGLYDATNVCNSSVSVITNVALDHMAYLGNTTKEIATEKSGIIKENSIVVIGEQNEEIVSLLKNVAREKSSKAYVINEDFSLVKNDQAVGGRLLSLQTPYGFYEDIFLPLLGAHQGNNALLALVAAESFIDDTFGYDVTAEAFDQASSPGRMEIISRQPLVLVDGAHNIAGAETLANALKEEFISERKIFVIALTKEKNAEAMLSAFEIEDQDFIIATMADSNKAMDAKVIGDAALSMGYENVIVKENSSDAFDYASSIAFDDDHIIVTGSLYLVGEIRKQVLS